MDSSTSGPNWDSFAPITSTDRAGYIWIAALYCLVTSTLVFVTRMWIKKNSFGQDDTLFALATAAQIGHVASIIVSLNHGLGSAPPQHGSQWPLHARDLRIQEGGRAAFAASIFLIISLTLAKCSVVMFMKRILARDLLRLYMVCHALNIVSVLWGIASIIALVSDCSASHYIAEDVDTKCEHQAIKWAGIAAFDVVTEILLMIMPVLIVWPLRMSRALKIQVCSAFMFRVGVIALAIAHAVYVSRWQHAGRPSLALVVPIVFAEAELCWSLVSSTIPNLKNFMRSFNTGFGQEFGLTTLTGISYPPGSLSLQRQNEGKLHASTATSSGIGGAIQLSRLSKNLSPLHSQMQSQRQSDENDQPSSGPEFVGRLNPQNNQYEIEVSRGEAQDAYSVGSGKSEDMIIRKNVTISQHYAKGSTSHF